MHKKAIINDRAPAANGPYSQAVISGGLLFTSGQLPIDPATGKISEGSIAGKTHIDFQDHTAIASATGTTLDSAVKTIVFLADIADFQAVNKVRPVPQRALSCAQRLSGGSAAIGCEDRSEAILEL